MDEKEKKVHIVKMMIQNKIELVFKGFNAEHMLSPPKKRRMLIKWKVQNCMIYITYLESEEKVQIEAYFGTGAKITPHNLNNPRNIIHFSKVIDFGKDVWQEAQKTMFSKDELRIISDMINDELITNEDKYTQFKYVNIFNLKIKVDKYKDSLFATAEQKDSDSEAFIK